LETHKRDCFVYNLCCKLILIESSAVLEGCKKFEQATPICDKIGLHSYQFYFLQLTLGSGADRVR